MRFSIIAALCGLLAGVVASPTTHSKRHVVHERRERLPINWNRGSELRSGSLLPMRFALIQSNLDRAEEFLMDVSHPDSPNFGKHWTSKQVAEAFAPSDITVESVIEWLADAGISSDRVRQSQGLNWVHAELTVEEAERLLKTKYYEYMHTKTGQTHIACDAYSIPEEIQKHVDFITPTVHFDTRVRATKKRRKVNSHEIQSVKRHTSVVGHKVEPGIAHSIGGPGDGSLPKQGDSIFPGNVLNELESCDTLISPDCLRALYLLPEHMKANPKSKSSYKIKKLCPSHRNQNLAHC
jgi:tripeptidyl-peptidase I